MALYTWKVVGRYLSVVTYDIDTEIDKEQRYLVLV